MPDDSILTEVLHYAQMSLGWLDRAAVLAPLPVMESTPASRDRSWRLLAVRGATSIPLEWLNLSIESTSKALGGVRHLRARPQGDRYLGVETLIGNNLTMLRLMVAARASVDPTVLVDVDHEFPSEALFEAMTARYALRWALTLDASVLKGWAGAWRAAVADMALESEPRLLAPPAKSAVEVDQVWMESTIRKMDSSLRDLKGY